MVSVLLASKLVTNKNPNLTTLIDTVNGWNIKEIWKADLLQLEFDVLTSLDFSLSFETPINFIDRFIMLFNSPDSSLVRKCADFLCVQMLKNNKFLAYRPS